ALNDEGGGDGQAHQNDDELDQVGDLVGNHAAEGGVEDDHQPGDNQGHVGGDTRQGGHHGAGGGDLAGGQAEQGQDPQHGGKGAGEFAEPAAHHLRDGDSHGLADLGGEVGQGDHGDGRRQHVPDGGHAPCAEGLLGKARGGPAADVVGGQGEGHHEK